MADKDSPSHEICRIYNIIQKTSLGKIHTLKFTYEGVTEILSSDDVHEPISNHNRVLKIPDVGNINTLSVAHTIVENVDFLGNVLDLNISYTNVFNMSPLTIIQIIHMTQRHTGVQNITNLQMKNCEDIIDLSYFKKLTTLSLIKCTKAININTLTELSDVTIEGTDIDDISCLCDVKYLLLSNLNGVTNFPVFVNAKRVSLFGFTQTPMVVISGNVKQFVIDVFENLIEICIDGKIKNLNLMCLPNLKNVSFSDRTIIENVLLCECSKNIGEKFTNRAKNVISEFMCRDF
jgi:hypothetical protein